MNFVTALITELQPVKLESTSLSYFAKKVNLLSCSSRNSVPVNVTEKVLLRD